MPAMITEVNLDTDPREVHYVCDNGRVEGLILEKDVDDDTEELEDAQMDSAGLIKTSDTRWKRPRSAKGRPTSVQERPTSAKGWARVRPGAAQERSESLTRVEINHKGVSELFADILYPDSGFKTVSDVENELTAGDDEDDDDDGWDSGKEDAEVVEDEIETVMEKSHGIGPNQLQISNINFVNSFRSPSILSGVKYTEWQRNSGLKVLRRVLDRQKILEKTDGLSDNSQEDMIQVFQRFKRRPPSKLKPLGQ